MDGETKTIVGTCAEISEKNGWTSFHIQVSGDKYPTRLASKLPEVIEQARQHGNTPGVWQFTETQGGENPNKPGTFYTNRYLDKVTPVGEAEAQQDTVVAKPVDWDARTLNITRQTIVKAVAPLLALPDDGDVGLAELTATVLGIASDIEAWVYREPAKEAEPVKTNASTPQYDPPAEDDVPF
jgi:hypothetical protein